MMTSDPDTATAECEPVVNHIEDYGHANIINAHLRLIAPPAGLCEWPQPPGFLNLSGLHYSGGLT